MKLILLTQNLLLQSGKFGGAPSDAQESQPQGIQYAEDAAEHENMKAVLKSSLQDGESGASTVPGLRTRTRASSTRGQFCPMLSHPVYHLSSPSEDECIFTHNMIASAVMCLHFNINWSKVVI